MSMVSIHFIKLTFYGSMSCENVCTLAKNTLHFYNGYSDFFCNDIKLLYKHELKFTKPLQSSNELLSYIFKVNALKDKDCDLSKFKQGINKNGCQILTLT